MGFKFNGPRSWKVELMMEPLPIRIDGLGLNITTYLPIKDSKLK